MCIVSFHGYRASALVVEQLATALQMLVQVPSGHPFSVLRESAGGGEV